MAGDERLVEQVRAGNEAAFEVVFERYGKGIISFCRHMLGSQDEAEDAVQQTFTSAYRDLLRDGDRDVRIKPWLYTIARNRCLSMLRARRDEVPVEWEPATTGLAEQVEQRAELRELLRDIRELPAEQRTALLLTETADLSHAEIADVLECEVARVKALVFRARSSLIDRREARGTPCQEIREQLAVLSGGSLRRSGIRHHLSSCSGCREYRDQIKQQRKLLAAIVPVVPPAWLKANVLGAAGGGGAAAGGAGGGVAGGASMAAAGAGTGAVSPVGTAVLAKVAVLAVLAGGGAVATEATLKHHGSSKGKSPAASPAAGRGAPDASGSSEAGAGSAKQGTSARGRAHSGAKTAKGHGRATRSHGAPAAKGGRGPADVPGSRGAGVGHRSARADGVPPGRGAPAAPPAKTPVDRGPVSTEHPDQPATSPPAHATPLQRPASPTDQAKTLLGDG